MEKSDAVIARLDRIETKQSGGIRQGAVDRPVENYLRARERAPAKAVNDNSAN
jgi:hypothetical protein